MARKKRVKGPGDYSWRVEVNVMGGIEPVIFGYKTKPEALDFARGATAGIEVESEGVSIIFPPHLVGRIFVRAMDA